MGDQLQSSGFDGDVTLSVVVPVFNTGAYLSECLESVLRQSLRAVEIIVVDDGSTDDSREIALDFARRYSSIRVLHQQRKRQGAARNLGLQHALGRYVAFLDSDDMIPADAYQVMVDAADANSADMVCGIQQSFNDRRTWVGVPVHQREFDRLVPRTSVREMPGLVGDISACNRIIRRDAIERAGLRFPEGTAGEDLDFIARAYLVCETITILPRVVYHYRGRPESRTRVISPQFFEDRVRMAEGLETAYGAAGLSDTYSRLLRSEIRKLVGNRLLRVMRESSWQDQRQIFDSISRLVAKLSDADRLSGEDFTLHERVRVVLIGERQFEALVAFELDGHIRRFLPLVVSERARANLLQPLLELQAERAGATLPPAAAGLVQRATRLLQRAARVLDRLRAAPLMAMCRYFVVAATGRLMGAPAGAGTIWLMDERISSSAEDNAYFLFRHLRHTRPDLPVYFVLNRDAPHWDRVVSLGNVVAQYSWQHAYLLHRATVLLSTDSFRSLAYPYEALPQWRRETLNVFLQHGVAGNKTMTYSKANYPYFSQVIVSNRVEQTFFRDHYGFGADQVKLTGIARLDALPLATDREVAAGPRTILVSPTWRRWLRNRKQIRNSHYFDAWSSLIADPRLARLLEQYDCTLHFKPHFSMMPFISAFEGSSPRVRIVRDEIKPLHELIREADVLITDYSSVMYDFFYQEKPVIAYMFDRVEWECQPPGPPHIRYEDDLAADLASDVDTVLDQLEICLERNCTMSGRNRARADSLFEYRDHGNCERICGVIDAALANRART